MGSGALRATLVAMARVVIVDDHPTFRRAMAELLRARGYDVVGEAACAASARHVVAALRPDAVALDVQLGADCGLALAGALTTAQAGLRVVLLSAGADPDPARVRASGACAFIRKSELVRTDFAALCRG